MKNVHQENLKAYWRKRLIVPTICVVTLLVCLLAGFAISNSRAADQRSLRDTISTLSLVLADPILTGEQLELLKRISTVASKLDLSIVVTNSKDQVIGAFPALFEGEAIQNHSGLSQPIYANNGVLLGHIAAVRKHEAAMIDSIAIFTALLVLFFGLIIFWIIRTVRPIFNDILSLTTSGLETNDKAPTEFKFTETQKTFETLRRQSEELVEREKEKLLVNVAGEVAHNIRSPLAALDNMVAALPQLPEADRENINSSISGIRDIANTLLTRLRSGLKMARTGSSMENAAANVHDSGEETSLFLLGQFVEQVISEKRFEFTSKSLLKIENDISDRFHFAFVKVQRAGLKSLFSNLINNAAESMGLTGTVQVSIVDADAGIKISIKDHGSGIPLEVMDKLGTEKITTKTDGNGLGLIHAFNCAKRWGGALKIDTEVGHGTTINLTLPKASEPNWFLPALQIHRSTNIVILDDSPGIIKAWEARLSSVNHGDTGIKLISFLKFDDLRRWYNQNPTESADATFLIDYDFGDPTYNGLDVIDLMGISSRGFLVTSHSDEKRLQQECAQKSMKMLPKALISKIPIGLMPTLERPDAIFVDDAESNHELWQMESPGKDIKYYFDGAAFLENCKKYSRATPVYVDFNFDDQELQGDSITKAASQYFKYVSLATYSKPSDLPDMPWLKEIRGKRPPWSKRA